MFKAKLYSLSRMLTLVLAGQAMLGMASPCAAALPAGAKIDLKVLVVGTTGGGSADPQTAAVTAILDRAGIPYDLSPSSQALPALEYAAPDNNHARYQGVIFAVSDIRMNPYVTWGGTQATADATRLAAYLYKYNIRLASFYTWPGDTGCLRLQGTAGISISATGADSLLTTAGAAALPYLKAGLSGTPLRLKSTFLYPTSQLPATGSGTPGADVLPAGASVTPWLTYNGQPIASVCQFKDASANPRHLLSVNVNNAAFLTHTQALSYGVVQWVTKGLHLGEVQTWLDPEIDDLFLADDEYPYTVLDDGRTYRFQDVTRNILGLGPAPTPVTCTPIDTATGTPCEYRNTGADFGNLVTWQNKLRGNSWGGARTINNRVTNTANTTGTDGVRLSMVYNGVGATVATADQPCGSLCEPAWPSDTLTTAVNTYSSEFKWINHTWDHRLLDAMAFTTTGTCPNNVIDAKTEVCWNDKIKQVLGLAKYDKEAFVTPEISGLYNRNVLDAFAVFSATPAVYLVSDTSKPTPKWTGPGSPCTPPPASAPGTYPLPGPNEAKYNCTALNTTATRPTQRYVYEVPRYPVSLFYLVTTPTEWTAAYNFFYGKNGVLPTPAVPPFVDGSGARRDQSYQEIVDYVSDTLLGYLLTYDSRPWMFHISNLRAYSGTRFLLGDLLEETLTKYNSIYQNQPIRSPRLKDLGVRMRNRMVYKSTGVAATYIAGTQNTIAVQAGAANATALPNSTDRNTVVIPITGVSIPQAGQSAGTGLANNPMTYGSGAAARTISYINVIPNASALNVGPAPAW